MDLLLCHELKPKGVRKGAWTKEEDELLRKCIEKCGEGKWSSVPWRAGLKRCRKSCRLRWLNYLSPNINRGKFNDDEVDLIIRLHKLLGNRWSLIAGRIPGRTANDIKNYWNSHLSKKLDAQDNKKIESIVNAKVVRPHPQRVSSSWIWSENLQEYGGEPQHEEFNMPKLTTRIVNQETWMNHLISGDEGDLVHNGNMSFQDLHTDYGTGEKEEILDAAVVLEGVQRMGGTTLGDHTCGLTHYH